MVELLFFFFFEILCLAFAFPRMLRPPTLDDIHHNSKLWACIAG